MLKEKKQSGQCWPLSHHFFFIFISEYECEGLEDKAFAGGFSILVFVPLFCDTVV